MNPARTAWPIAPASRLMWLAVVVFAIVAGTLQCVRGDLDPIAAPLSFYLGGPGSLYLRLAYYLISAALLIFALGSYRATTPPLRSRLASTLFAGPGVALPAVAITTLYYGTPQAEFARFAHGMAAQATFLWLSFGMLLLSARWRRDPLLGKGSTSGWIVAWLATIVLWLQVFLPRLPHGLMQKLTIALILVWLAWAARHMRRAIAT